MIAAFTLVDLVFRPSFIPIHIDSDDVLRGTPPIVSILHLAVNAAFALPVIYGALKYGFDLKRVSKFAMVCAALVAVVLISIVGVFDLELLAVVVILVANLVLAALFAATNYTRDSGLSGVFKGMAIGGTLVLVGVLAVGEYTWGRLSSNAGPNWWGALAFISLLSALALRGWVVKTAVAAICLAVLVLTSSRGSMIAVGAGGVLAAVLLARGMRGKSGLLMIAATLLLLIPFVIAGPWLAESLFHLSDPARGLNSGGTGRSYGWRDAWRLFESRPIFGIGFRRHELFMTRTSTAHQAYLAVLAELGLVGFAVYITLVFGATIQALRRALASIAPVWIAASAFMAGFLAIGFVESSSLMMGVPTCLLMVIVVACAWATRRRGPRQDFSLASRSMRPISNDRRHS
ncbi:hypothetical protein BZG35_05605 [Brevundimonas sp. LM2]|nr:hypothetical protein BZG35_05605 [Brevundimonas sp. LM2]